jgi:hypothetical protein
MQCPLNNAQEPAPEKKPYSLGTDQPKLIITSATDTIAKACTAGTVTTILRDEDGRWEVMVNNKDYYFDYAGLSVLKVVKGQRLRPGDAVGVVKRSDKLEVMIYDFETPLDPRSLLNCFK